MKTFINKINRVPPKFKFIKKLFKHSIIKMMLINLKNLSPLKIKIHRKRLIKIERK